MADYKVRCKFCGAVFPTGVSGPTPPGPGQIINFTVYCPYCQTENIINANDVLPEE